jgi:hypothetical protein
MIDQLAMSEMKLTTRWTIHENDLNKPQVERTARFLITASLSPRRCRRMCVPSIVSSSLTPQ